MKLHAWTCGKHHHLAMVVVEDGDYGPRISLNAFPLDGETRFLFWKIDFYCLKNDLESPLIFIFIFKG